jgi:FixJ family two-component response regulator
MNERSPSAMIAVVDDDQSVLRSLEYLLESADYGVRLFSSGPQLLESGCLPEFACLISDIDMPGMEGFELLRRVRAARPDLPVILISGYPETLRRLPGMGLGEVRCFNKPFQGSELLAAVSESIRDAHS